MTSRAYTSPPSPLRERDPDHAVMCRATQEATWNCSPALAEELGVSARWVEYWGQPQYDKPGPAYRFLKFLRALVENQPDPAAAIAPLQAVCAEAGGTFVAREASRPTTVRGFNRRLTSAVGTFGALLESIDEALSDARVDRGELEAAQKCIHDHLSVVYQLEQRLKKACAERSDLS